MTSADEADRFREHHGAPVRLGRLGDRHAAARRRPAKAKPHVVWLGDHNYHANVHGLLRFLREGWRPLGERGLRLQVVGRNPSDEVLALAAELPGVDVLGLRRGPRRGCSPRRRRPWCPVWKGAGIKMKTLVLMGGGLPVATTTRRASRASRRVDGGTRGSRTNPLASRRPIGDLVANRERAAELGLAGRQLILDAHTWDGVIPQVEAVLERVAR